MSEEEKLPAQDVAAERTMRRKHSPQRAAKKRALAQRITRLMEVKNMTAAELARAASLNRDVISTTLLGKTFPTPQKLAAIAQVLGVEMSDLTEEYAYVHEARLQSVARMEEHQARRGYSLLTINKIVRTSLAVRIISMIHEDESATRPD